MSRSFPVCEVKVEEALQFLETHNLSEPEIQGNRGSPSGEHSRNACVRTGFL
jgi:hypothetical protein